MLYWSTSQRSSHCTRFAERLGSSLREREPVLLGGDKLITEPICIEALKQPAVNLSNMHQLSGLC